MGAQRFFGYAMGLGMDRLGIRDIMKNAFSLAERINDSVEELFDLRMDLTEHRIVGLMDITCYG